MAWQVLKSQLLFFFCFVPLNGRQYFFEFLAPSSSPSILSPADEFPTLFPSLLCSHASFLLSPVTLAACLLPPRAAVAAVTDCAQWLAVRSLRSSHQPRSSLCRALAGLACALTLSIVGDRCTRVALAACLDCFLTGHSPSHFALLCRSPTTHSLQLFCSSRSYGVAKVDIAILLQV